MTNSNSNNSIRNSWMSFFDTKVTPTTYTVRDSRLLLILLHKKLFRNIQCLRQVISLFIYFFQHVEVTDFYLWYYI